MNLPYEPCKFLDSPLRPLERWGYRLARVDLQHQMSWRPDASSFVLFSLACTALLSLILRSKSFLPFIVNNWRPFENPTPLSNLTEIMSIVLLSVALTRPCRQMIGRMKRSWRSWPLFRVVVALFTSLPFIGRLIR